MTEERMKFVYKWMIATLAGAKLSNFSRSTGFARVLTTKRDESELPRDALGSLKSETNQRLVLGGDNICNLRMKSE